MSNTDKVLMTGDLVTIERSLDASIYRVGRVLYTGVELLTENTIISHSLGIFPAYKVFHATREQLAERLNS